MIPRTLLAAAAVLLFVAATPETNRPLPQLGETMEVSIVNVDVFVTDKKGNRVRGLTRDDFQVFDGAARQPISNFAEYSSNAPAGDVTASVPATAEVAPPQKRTVVVFFERMRLRTFEADALVASIKKTLRSIVRPGDSVAVVLWAWGATAHVEFTGDLATIDAALDTVARDAAGVEVDGDRLLNEHADAIRRFEAEASAMAASKGMGTSSFATGPDDTSREIFLFKQMAEMRARVAAIDATISSMASQEGKKVLLLAPRTLGEIVGGTGNKIAATQWQKHKWGTEQMLKPILENANASGVTIYPIFAPGLRLTMQDATAKDVLDRYDSTYDHVALLNEMFSLTRIAEKTGGLAASNVTDIVKLLPRIEEDVTDYYSLAFRGDMKNADRVRNIVVKTKNPAYVVRSRRQYVEKTDSTRMKDRVAAALMLVPNDAFDIEATVGSPRKSRKTESVPLTIRIPISALTVLPGNDRQAGAFSVFIAAGSDQGAASDVTQMTQPFALADVKSVKDGHFTYRVDVVIDHKTDRIAVGVLDEISKEYALLRVALPRV